MQSVKSKVQDLIKGTQVLVFSKTYCPYCDEAKNIFRSAEVTFAAHELDKMDDGADLQNALGEITGQKTVPNIFVNGQHIGGCSDLKAKIKNGELINILDTAGIHYSL